jgi:hypothetical protein
MTLADRDALTVAVKSLEHPSLAARLTNLVGKPVELVGYALPSFASKAIASATTKGLEAALKVALRTLQRSRRTGSELLHRALATASGAAGGTFGLAALPRFRQMRRGRSRRRRSARPGPSGIDIGALALDLACRRTHLVRHLSGRPRRGASFFVERPTFRTRERRIGRTACCADRKKMEPGDSQRLPRRRRPDRRGVRHGLGTTGRELARRQCQSATLSDGSRLQRPESRGPGAVRLQDEIRIPEGRRIDAHRNAAGEQDPPAEGNHQALGRAFQDSGYSRNHRPAVARRRQRCDRLARLRSAKRLKVEILNAHKLTRRQGSRLPASRRVVCRSVTHRTRRTTSCLRR